MTQHDNLAGAVERYLYGQEEEPPADPYADVPHTVDLVLVENAQVEATDRIAADGLLDRMRAALIDSEGLDSIPEPEPLIDGVLFRDTIAWLQGKPGDGKSFVALDMSGCVGTGEHWQGHPVTTGPVIYLAAEGVSGIRQRVRAWEQAMGTAMTNVRWLPLPVQASDRTQWSALIELVREQTPILIVIDTQARVTVGMEENAAKDMGVFVDRLERLRRASAACVLVIHHMGRNGEHMRGSTALEGAAATILKVVKDEDVLTLSNPKQKDAEEFEDVQLRLVPTGSSADLMPTDGPRSGDATKVSSSVIKMARAWWETFGRDEVTANKLIKAEVATERSFYRNVKVLITRGEVIKQIAGRSTYYHLLYDPDDINFGGGEPDA